MANGPSNPPIPPFDTLHDAHVAHVEHEARIQGHWQEQWRRCDSMEARMRAVEDDVHKLKMHAFRMATVISIMCAVAAFLGGFVAQWIMK